MTKHGWICTAFSKHLCKAHIPMTSITRAVPCWHSRQHPPTTVQQYWPLHITRHLPLWRPLTYSTAVRLCITCTAPLYVTPVVQGSWLAVTKLGLSGKSTWKDCSSALFPYKATGASLPQPPPPLFPTTASVPGHPQTQCHKRKEHTGGVQSHSHCGLFHPYTRRCSSARVRLGFLWPPPHWIL